MIVSPYYQNGVIVFSERYERPDPISLPSERTHGDWGMLLTNPMENPSLALQLLLYPFPLLLTLLLFPYTLLLILRLCVSRVLFTGCSFPSRAISDCVHTNDDTPIAINCDNK